MFLAAPWPIRPTPIQPMRGLSATCCLQSIDPGRRPAEYGSRSAGPISASSSPVTCHQCDVARRPAARAASRWPTRCGPPRKRREHGRRTACRASAPAPGARTVEEARELAGDVGVRAKAAMSPAQGPYRPPVMSGLPQWSSTRRKPGWRAANLVTSGISSGFWRSESSTSPAASICSSRAAKRASSIHADRAVVVARPAARP